MLGTGAGVRIAIAIILSGCGSSQPKCFECGLTDEWARAEREQQERAEQERLARIDALKRAVAEGEPPESDPHGSPREIAEAFEDNDEHVLKELVAALEKSCERQAGLTLAWTYDWFAKHPPSTDELSYFRRRAFEQIAASRGGAAAPELAGCPNTPIAEICASTTTLADTRAARCAGQGTSTAPGG